ncbi:MAG TPA: SIMPL domain-containing protein [Sphingomicrobium sp.]|nr:SIMPL domain-containing protein [Sphingomicrobium sp.]
MRALALVPFLFVAACERAAPDPRGVERGETLLTVTASGSADTRPDEARLQLGVQSLAASAGEASRLNREKMQEVTVALQRLGVREQDLQTRNLSLQRIDHGPERGRFRAHNVLEVTMRDMDKVGEAVTMVTEAGANVLSGPDLRVSNRESANRSAYADAYRAARERADAYAQAAGLEVERVLAIYDGGDSGMPIPMPRMVTMDATAQAAAPPPVAAPFSPGMNTSEVRVRVDFALGRK